MGIRNLAFCILDIPPTVVINAEPVSSIPETPIDVAAEQLPQIQAWHRLSVSAAPEATDDSSAPLKEAFDPATLSSIAYLLLRERLMLKNPTHILIERQRFRSMGSKHILEWTIRVNLFESIIYAVLCTLKAEGAWNGEVVGILPGRVGPFWIPDAGIINTEGLSKVRLAKSAKVQNKGKKVDLVRRWLDAGNVVSLGTDQVKATARQYIEKWDRAPGGIKGRKKGTNVDTGKLDDFADCLLQGMAWVKWEENKRLALNHGVEQLLDIPTRPNKSIGQKTEDKVKEKKLARKQPKKLK
jgi:cruciform cutting endonuclease 1